MTLRNSRHIYDISRILTKKDYNDSTEKLLIKPVHYNEAIKVFDEIIGSGLFSLGMKDGANKE